MILGLSVFMCTQIGAARQEEADQALETMLAQPLARERWLAGRLVLAVAGACALALMAGLLAWAGAATTGAHISLLEMVEAGANALPVALLFLGVAALAYAVVPRASGAIAYGLVTAGFLWYLVGALVGAPTWLVDVTPFNHVGLIPTEPFRLVGAVVMLALGLVGALAALVLFRRRDLLSA